VNNSYPQRQSLLAQLEINLAQVSLEQLVHYTAIEYFLTIEDQPDSDATNLATVNQYLESFHHLRKKSYIFSWAIGDIIKNKSIYIRNL